MSKKIVVLGGGPSGMMAAISAKKHHPDAVVSLLDRNKRLGTKLRISGGGRCNVTADVSDDEVVEHIPKNGKFLYSSLTHFGPKEILSFFPENGTPLKEEDHHRMFPATNKSADIVLALERSMSDLGVLLYMETDVEDIDVDKKIVKCAGKSFPYDHLIMAAGGKTYPGTGSDGTGYRLAELFGHTITELIPAEVPLVSNDRVIQEKTLQGLSFHDIEITVYKKGKVKKTLMHDLLFAHFGLTGPAALRASFYVMDLLKKYPTVDVSIDYVPSLNFGEVKSGIAEMGLEEFMKSHELPKRLTTYIESISETEDEIVSNIKKMMFSVYDTRGFAHAFVTNGGVSLKEIDPKTMKSKLNPSLSFAGELMDISAFTGGFNITTAFSSGFTAGKFALEEK